MFGQFSIQFMEVFGPFNGSSTMSAIKQNNIIFWFCTLTWNFKETCYITRNNTQLNIVIYFNQSDNCVYVSLYLCEPILRNLLFLRDLSIWYVLIISSRVINLYVSFLIVKMRVVKKLFLHCSLQSTTPA